MCVVSAVMPQIKPWIDSPGWPTPLPPGPDLETARLLREVLDRLDKIDQKLGLKDCKEEKEEKERVFKKLKELVGG